MGYTTFFSGEITIEPPLNEDEISFLKDFNRTRRMHRANGPLFVGGEGWQKRDNPDEIYDNNRPDPDQPGLWCQWVPTDDGTAIQWDEGEKFYEAGDWMAYVVSLLAPPVARPYIDAHINEDPRLKSFTCDHVLNGEIYADGEDSEDNWKIKVTNNQVEILYASMLYGDEEPEVVPPTEEEMRAALKSLGGTTKIKVWSLTIDGPNSSSIVTCVFPTEREVYEHLKGSELTEDDPDFDLATQQGDLVQYLCDAGYCLYIDEHTLEVPA